MESSGDLYFRVPQFETPWDKSNRLPDRWSYWCWLLVSWESHSAENWMLWFASQQMNWLIFWKNHARKKNLPCYPIGLFVLFTGLKMFPHSRIPPFPHSQYCFVWCHLNRNSSATEFHLRWQVQRHVTMVKQADRWYTAAEGGNTLPDRPQETHDLETIGWELRYKMCHWKAPWVSIHASHSKNCIQDEAILFPT